MVSNLVELDTYILARVFIYIPTLYLRVTKVLVRLHGCWWTDGVPTLMLAGFAGGLMVIRDLCWRGLLVD